MCGLPENQLAIHYSDVDSCFQRRGSSLGLLLLYSSLDRNAPVKMRHGGDLSTS
jgi:hypothetical protein